MNASHLALALLSPSVLLACSKPEPSPHASAATPSPHTASVTFTAPTSTPTAASLSPSTPSTPSTRSTPGVMLGAASRPADAALPLGASLAEATKRVEAVRTGEVPGEAHDPEHEHEAGRAWRPGLDGTPGDGMPRWPCREDRAFRASSPLVFEAPTDPALIAALTEATAGSSKSAPSISLVFQHAASGGELLAALTPTRSSSGGRHALFSTMTPSTAPLIRAFGDEPAVTTEQALPTGALRLLSAAAERSSPSFLNLRRVMWRASATGDPTRPHGCDELTVDVHALLPLSQLSVVLPLSGRPRTVGEVLQIPIPSEGFDDDGLADDIRVRGHLPAPPPIHFHFRASAGPLDPAGLPGVDLAPGGGSR